MKQVAIFGATGSIGQSSLDILENHQDRFAIHTLHAHTSCAGLAELVAKHRPKYAVISDKVAYEKFKGFANISRTKLLVGEQGLIEAASNKEIDITINGIVGMAGLIPSWHVIDRGGVLILANKECLATAGKMLMDRARVSGATILPADSEHNAIHQVFPYDAPHSIKRLIITASGGPFLRRPIDTLHTVTLQEAVAHPNWNMGVKISIDSATMMNKGLEIIEAHHLFAMSNDKIDIVIHPQSAIHSLVEFHDGSLLAQIGPADMRVALANCLASPDRLDLNLPKFDLVSLSRMDFMHADPKQFPALNICRQAICAGGDASLIVNAANEVAVAAFQTGAIKFSDIISLIEQTLQHDFGKPYDDVVAAKIALDCDVRKIATRAIGGMTV